MIRESRGGKPIENLEDFLAAMDNFLSFLSKTYLKYDFIIDESNNAGVIGRFISLSDMIL